MNQEREEINGEQAQRLKAQRIIDDLDMTAYELEKATASLPKKIVMFILELLGIQVSSSTIGVEAWNLHGFR